MCPDIFQHCVRYLSGIVDQNSVFYSSGRAVIFEGPSPRRDEDPFFVGNGGELKKVKSFLQKFFTGKVSRLPINPRKPRKFSTSNDLHYTVTHSFLHANLYQHFSYVVVYVIAINAHLGHDKWQDA